MARLPDGSNCAAAPTSETRSASSAHLRHRVRVGAVAAQRRHGPVQQLVDNALGQLLNHLRSRGWERKAGVRWWRGGVACAQQQHTGGCSSSMQQQAGRSWYCPAAFDPAILLTFFCLLVRPSPSLLSVFSSSVARIDSACSRRWQARQCRVGQLRSGCAGSAAEVQAGQGSDLLDLTCTWQPQHRSDHPTSCRSHNRCASGAGSAGSASRAHLAAQRLDGGHRLKRVAPRLKRQLLLLEQHLGLGRRPRTLLLVGRHHLLRGEGGEGGEQADWVGCNQLDGRQVALQTCPSGSGGTATGQLTAQPSAQPQATAQQRTSLRSSTLYTMALPSSSFSCGAMLRGTEMSTNRRTPPTWGRAGTGEGRHAG